jgi:hypothetical protein
MVPDQMYFEGSAVLEAAWLTRAEIT